MSVSFPGFVPTSFSLWDLGRRWRQERELSRAERLELQQLLAQRGFYRGTPDGQLGGETREALRGFQASIGAPADGFASSDVLERLRGR